MRERASVDENASHDWTFCLKKLKKNCLKIFLFMAPHLQIYKILSRTQNKAVTDTVFVQSPTMFQCVLFL